MLDAALLSISDRHVQSAIQFCPKPLEVKEGLSVWCENWVENAPYTLLKRVLADLADNEGWAFFAELTAF